jgi:hypothetical protein
MAESRSNFTRRIQERNRTRSWLLRLPILLWLGLVARDYLVDPTEGTLWDGINLAFHEMGHVLFLAFPELVTVAGGTLLQLAIPMVAGWMLIRQKDDFGGAVALVWLGTNFMGVALYAGDARAQVIPLVSPFPGEVTHDWNFLLSELGLLHRDQAIAGVFRAAGQGALLSGVLLGAWILLAMATDPVRRRNRSRRVAVGSDSGSGAHGGSATGSWETPHSSVDQWEQKSGATPRSSSNRNEPKVSPSSEETHPGSVARDVLFGPTWKLDRKPDPDPSAMDHRSTDPLPSRPPDPDLAIPPLPDEVVKRALEGMGTESVGGTEEPRPQKSSQQGDSARDASLRYLEEKERTEGLSRAETRFLNWLRRQTERSQ